MLLLYLKLMYSYTMQVHSLTLGAELYFIEWIKPGSAFGNTLRGNEGRF